MVALLMVGLWFGRVGYISFVPTAVSSIQVEHGDDIVWLAYRERYQPRAKASLVGLCTVWLVGERVLTNTVRELLSLNHRP